MIVLYHPSKAKVVVDALSRMKMSSMSHIEEDKIDLVKDVHRLALLGFRLEDFPNGGFMVHNNFESCLVVEVKSKKHPDLLLMELKKSVLVKLNESSS